MIELTAADRDGLITHAREQAPDECCGVLLGVGSQVREVRRLVNADHSPKTYRVDPRVLLGIFRELDESGLELLGVYHSHTHTAAYPSPTDVSYARGYPDAAYVIVSLADESAPVVRSFRIRDGQIAEEDVVIREAVAEAREGQGDQGCAPESPSSAPSQSP